MTAVGDSSVPTTWLQRQLGRLRPKAGNVAPDVAGEPEAPGPPKPTVAVVTDSAAALPPEWIAEISHAGLLTVVPIPVIIGENVYSDDDAELETHMSLALASGTPVKTSRPSPGQFERAYQRAAAAGFEHIVSLHMSAKLSGTFDAALLAAERSSIPVHVVDSATVGMGQGRGVQAAVETALHGAGPAEVMAAALAAFELTEVFFYVPSLEQLRRGGRISLASSWLGTVLDIKPILGIRDGAIVPLEKVRTAARAIARLEALAAADIAARGASGTRISVHHFGNEAQARTLGKSLETGSPGLADATLTRLPAVLAAHAGLGVLVVVVSGALVPDALAPGAAIPGAAIPGAATAGPVSAPVVPPQAAPGH